MNSKADSCHQKNIFVRDAFLAVTGQNGVRRDRATGDGRKHHTSSNPPGPQNVWPVTARNASLTKMFFLAGKNPP